MSRYKKNFTCVKVRDLRNVFLNLSHSVCSNFSLKAVDLYSVKDCIKKVPKDSREKKLWKIILR